ncbi:hypothetical protein [Labrys wisconsinensis]|uniref:Uncharacterized protein n=1 Tax=Labrys wisconsinensis TaxID=425677 RepID=A0ABU0J5R0_9HYPH|nr:hypothetical protein [Labrys wisconsinensis]MDQ0469593.1 hypothetical protein [Labrys wisconsinensis]
MNVKSDTVSASSAVGALCCPHIFRDLRKVLLVDRRDGDWQFLCGESDHGATDLPHFVHLGHMLRKDPTLSALGDLPADWEAERARPDQAWARRPCEP